MAATKGNGEGLEPETGINTPTDERERLLKDFNLPAWVDIEPILPELRLMEEYRTRDSTFYLSLASSLGAGLITQATVAGAKAIASFRKRRKLENGRDEVMLLEEAVAFAVSVVVASYPSNPGYLQGVWPPVPQSGEPRLATTLHHTGETRMPNGTWKIRLADMMHDYVVTIPPGTTDPTDLTLDRARRLQ